MGAGAKTDTQRKGTDMTHAQQVDIQERKQLYEAALIFATTKTSWYEGSKQELPIDEAVEKAIELMKTLESASIEWEDDHQGEK